MKKILMMLLAVMVFSMCTLAEAAEYIEAEGIVYYEAGMSPNQMRRMSVMDAYRYLAEQVDTLYVKADTTVKNMREMDDIINTKVRAIVRMSLYGEPQSLSGAVLQDNIRIEEIPKPRFISVRSEINYTGLIIDCRGLNLSAAIAPAIKSIGGIEIYAYKNIGYQNAVGKGLVEYSSDLNATRAGTTPLVIKAVKISGSCDVVVSDEDAEKILSANQSSNILINCAVVLVR